MKKIWFVILMLPILAWAAESPFDGTWKIDVSSVQFPEKPLVVVLHNGMYENSSAVPKVNIKADGKDQPVAGAKDYDTVAVKVVDDKTVEIVTKKGDKVVNSAKVTVSADGKTNTEEFTEYPVASKQPVTGKANYIRIAAGPSGSHAVSGSWRIQKVNASENALTATYKMTADGMAFSSSVGESYDAKFDGKDYPMKGAPAGYTVSLNKVDDRTIVTTVKRDGKIVGVNHSTVSPNGKTCTVKEENKVQGTTITYTAVKQ